MRINIKDGTYIDVGIRLLTDGYLLFDVFGTTGDTVCSNLEKSEAIQLTNGLLEALGLNERVAEKIETKLVITGATK